MIDISIANFVTVGIMALLFEAIYRMVAAMFAGGKAA
jgi:hypothetical protein